MTTNPNQDQRPDPADKYGGYSGYRPPNPVDDPYGASQEDRSQQSDPNYVYGQQGQGQQSRDGQGQQQQQYNYEPPESVLRRQGRRSSGSSSTSNSAASRGPVEKDDRKFALYSLLMVLAYQGVRVKLPIVGHYAEALMARFSSD